MYIYTQLSLSIYIYIYIHMLLLMHDVCRRLMEQAWGLVRYAPAPNDVSP